MMQGALALTWLVTFTGLMMFFNGITLHNLLQQSRSRDYQTVTGTVTRSETRPRRNSEVEVFHEPFFKYQYEVAGQSFTADKLRFTDAPRAASVKAEIIPRQPVGATVQVFYNPAKPQEAVLFNGLQGSDFLTILLLTPFNATALILWLWVGSMIGGQPRQPAPQLPRIATNRGITRIRLPQAGPIAWGAGVTGGLGFIATLALGLNTNLHPSIPLVVFTIAAVYLAGVGAFVWRRRVVPSSSQTQSNP